MKALRSFSSLCWPATASLACLALSGCASQLPELVDSLNAEAPCCESFGELAFDAMPDSDELKFSVGPGDQVFLFPSGKSYLKAYRLPPGEGTRAMEIRTYLVGEWIPTAHVFVPYLTVLDKSFEPVGEPLVPELFYEEGWFDGSSWTGIASIPPEGEYIVVHTSPDLVNKKISLGSTTGYAYTTGTGTTYVPPSGERSSSLGIAGNLRIKFLPTVQ